MFRIQIILKHRIFINLKKVQIMLKNLLEVSGITILQKNQQQAIIKGGNTPCANEVDTGLCNTHTDV